MGEQKYREPKALACDHTASHGKARTEPYQSVSTVHALGTPSLQVGSPVGAGEASTPTYLSASRDWSMRGAQMDGNYQPFVPHVMPQLKVHYQFLAAPYTVSCLR